MTSLTTAQIDIHYTTERSQNRVSQLEVRVEFTFQSSVSNFSLSIRSAFFSSILLIFFASFSLAADIIPKLYELAGFPTSSGFNS